jgi:uncharacterized lipoprotein YmbA
MKHLPLALLLLLAACSTSTRVYDLSAAGPPPSAATSQQGPVIYIDRPTLAAYFDRTQMVTRTETNRVSIHEFEVWSDPPADLITRALVDDLAARFGADRVMASPAIAVPPPAWRVGLDVTRFDVEEGDAVRGQPTPGTAVLDARWTLLHEPGARPGPSRRARIDLPVADVSDPTTRVAALRAAVAALAGQIGDAIAAGH